MTLCKYLYSRGMDPDDDFVRFGVMFTNFSTNFAPVVSYKALLSGHELHSKHRLEPRAYEIGFEKFGSRTAQVALPGVETYGVPRVRGEVDAVIIFHVIRRGFHRLDDPGVVFAVLAGGTDAGPDDRTLRQALARRHFAINKTRKTN